MNNKLDNKSAWQVLDLDGFHIYDIFLRKSFHTFREVQHALTDRHLSVFFSANLLILMLLDPHGYRNIVPVWITVVIWSVIAIIDVALVLLTLKLFGYLNKKYSNIVVFYPAIGWISMLIATACADMFVSEYSGERFDIAVSMSHLPINIAIETFLEAMYFWYVRPQVLINLHYQLDMESRNDNTLRIGGDCFVISHIVLIRGQDHYVEVTTNTETKLIRARMKDFVPHIDARDGVVPHRSYWVARHVIESVSSVAEGNNIVLRDGRIIPVAEKRKPEVKMWLKQHRSDIVWGE